MRFFDYSSDIIKAVGIGIICLTVAYFVAEIIYVVVKDLP